MRFRFRGCDRDTGKPLEGHVEASDTEAAYQVLSDHGIVTETLSEGSMAADLLPDISPVSQFADALDDALDASSSQVAFDDLSERYRGKKVWVVDRDKIRQKVAQVVDATLAVSEQDLHSEMTARQRVAEAIDGLFDDTRNIASQHDVQTVEKMRAMVEAAARTATNAGLAEQIGRLTGVVQQAEGLIAAMQTALRNVESGGTPRRRLVAALPSFSNEQSGVLREIFQSNLELRRALSIAGDNANATSAAVPSPVKATGSN